MVKHISKERQEPRDLGILLALAYSAFATELRAWMKGDAGFDDIHPSFGYVARNLAEAEATGESALTLTDLAARLEITTPGALKIVQAMEDTGYLERKDDAHDARAKRLHLTKRGKSALAAARSFHTRFEKSLVKEHGTKSVGALRELLEAIVHDHETTSASLTLRQM